MTNTIASTTSLPKRFSPWIKEEEILSGLVQNKQKLITFIEEISPEFFNSMDCKNIFKMIKVYFEKYKSPPKKNVLISSIQKMMSTNKNISPSIFNTVDNIFEREILTEDETHYFHDEVLKFIKTGKIRDVIFEGVNKIDDPEAFDEIQDKLKQAVLWRIDENLGIDITNIRERYSRQKEMLDSFIPTPWPSLNNYLGGGFFPKTLNCFVAGSSVGKSIALDQIAFDSWMNQKKNVLEITLELSEEMKGMRIDAHFMNKFIVELKDAETEVESAYSKINSEGKRFILKEFPTSSISARKIAQFIQRLQMYSGFTPEVLVVDYADLLLPNSGKKPSLYEAGGEIFEQLRGLAGEFGIPVITATQFNRSIQELPPEQVSEFSVSDSSKKMNTVDTLIGIIATSAMRSQGQAAFKTLKSRMGQKDAIVPMNISYEFFKFFE